MTVHCLGILEHLNRTELSLILLVTAAPYISRLVKILAVKVKISGTVSSMGIRKCAWPTYLKFTVNKASLGM